MRRHKEQLVDDLSHPPTVIIDAEDRLVCLLKGLMRRLPLRPAVLIYLRAARLDKVVAGRIPTRGEEDGHRIPRGAAAANAAKVAVGATARVVVELVLTFSDPPRGEDATRLDLDARLDSTLFSSAVGIRELWERYSTFMDRFYVGHWKRWVFIEPLSEAASIGLLPKWVESLISNLLLGGMAWAEAEKAKIADLNWRIIVQKPA